MAVGTWRYRVGLLLIASVVLIWVASAEVTQLIFARYRHPFLLTWLGASLLAIYLPLSVLKDKLSPWAKKSAAAVIRTIPPVSPTTRSPRFSALDLELQSLSKGGAAAAGVKDVEEEKALIQREGEGGKPGRPHGAPVALTTPSQLFHTALVLAPLWLLTEYLSNAALSLTSVASTTILSSTSALFTLLVGAALGQDQLTAAKVVAVVVCILGVVMTELGKTSALDELKPPDGAAVGSDSTPGHSILGDFLGLASAASYGFYTVLLRKYVGGEEGETDMQKVFGYIGLVTLLGLWWLAVPLVLLGWEPALAVPSSKGLDEDILANGLIGSVISDYFWALSVVWTTPLVATLGLSLTIPLAMVADMVIHGRSYSLVYVLGSAQVFGGFLIANAGGSWSLFDRISKVQG